MGKEKMDNLFSQNLESALGSALDVGLDMEKKFKDSTEERVIERFVQQMENLVFFRTFIGELKNKLPEESWKDLDRLEDRVVEKLLLMMQEDNRWRAEQEPALWKSCMKLLEDQKDFKQLDRVIDAFSPDRNIHPPAKPSNHTPRALPRRTGLAFTPGRLRRNPPARNFTGVKCLLK